MYQTRVKGARALFSVIYFYFYRNQNYLNLAGILITALTINLFPPKKFLSKFEDDYSNKSFP